MIQGRLLQPRGNIVFDDELVTRVKKFQLSEGLVPDGIVGTHTLILINTATKADIPALSRNQREN